MGKLLKALLDKTGISRFFNGVSVELPAYFLPSFQVVEIQNVKRTKQGRIAKAGN
jgi:hypothetical protein